MKDRHIGDNDNRFSDKKFVIFDQWYEAALRTARELQQQELDEKRELVFDFDLLHKFVSDLDDLHKVEVLEYIVRELRRKVSPEGLVTTASEITGSCIFWYDGIGAISTAANRIEEVIQDLRPLDNSEIAIATRGRDSNARQMWEGTPTGLAKQQRERFPYPATPAIELSRLTLQKYDVKDKSGEIYSCEKFSGIIRYVDNSKPKKLA